VHIEYDTKIVTIDDDLSTVLQKLNEEGWTSVPGLKSVAILNLQRVMGQVDIPMPQAQGTGLGKLTIDESKIYIIRDGKRVES
jgi:hypothetical protein